MPESAYSVAIALVIEITPPMAAAKIGWPSAPVAPCDVVVMKRPQPRSAIAGNAARASQNFCDKNKLMNCWYVSSSAVRVPSMIAPAQPTTMSSFPNSSTALCTALRHPSGSATES